MEYLEDWALCMGFKWWSYLLYITNLLFYSGSYISLNQKTFAQTVEAIEELEDEEMEELKREQIDAGIRTGYNNKITEYLGYVLTAPLIIFHANWPWEGSCPCLCDC